MVQRSEEVLYIKTKGDAGSMGVDPVKSLLREIHVGLGERAKSSDVLRKIKRLQLKLVALTQQEVVVGVNCGISVSCVPNVPNLLASLDLPRPKPLKLVPDNVKADERVEGVSADRCRVGDQLPAVEVGEWGVEVHVPSRQLSCFECRLWRFLTHVDATLASTGRGRLRRPLPPLVDTAQASSKTALPARPAAGLNRIDRRSLCSLVLEELMVTIVVGLLLSLIAYLVGSAAAACCERAPDVLSTPPLAI